MVFLHEVAAGVADRSYGIQVAKLAGLPPPVIARAAEVLALLEKKREPGASAKSLSTICRYSRRARPRGASPGGTAPDPSEIEKRLEQIFAR